MHRPVSLCLCIHFPPRNFFGTSSSSCLTCWSSCVGWIGTLYWQGCCVYLWLVCLVLLSLSIHTLVLDSSELNSLCECLGLEHPNFWSNVFLQSTHECSHQWLLRPSTRLASLSNSYWSLSVPLWHVWDKASSKSSTLVGPNWTSSSLLNFAQVTLIFSSQYTFFIHCHHWFVSPSKWKVAKMTLRSSSVPW